MRRGGCDYSLSGWSGWPTSGRPSGVCGRERGGGGRRDQRRRPWTGRDGTRWMRKEYNAMGRSCGREEGVSGGLI